MSNQGKYTFGKEEHLCKRMLIEKLFAGQAKSMTAWPIRMVYLLVDYQEGHDELKAQKASVQVLMSVSKRYFKRAVKRNRVKRQLREAYRCQKQALEEQMACLEGKRLLVAFVWQENRLWDTSKIDAKVGTLLDRLVEKLNDEVS